MPPQTGFTSACNTYTLLVQVRHCACEVVVDDQMHTCLCYHVRDLNLLLWVFLVTVLCKEPFVPYSNSCLCYTYRWCCPLSVCSSKVKTFCIMSLALHARPSSSLWNALLLLYWRWRKCALLTNAVMSQKRLLECVLKDWSWGRLSEEVDTHLHL